MITIPCWFGQYLGWSFKFLARSWQTSKNFEKKRNHPHPCVLVPGHVLFKWSMHGSRGSLRVGRLWQTHTADYMGWRWSFKSTIGIWMTIIPCWFGRFFGGHSNFLPDPAKPLKILKKITITPIHACSVSGHVLSWAASARSPRVAAIWPLAADACVWFHDPQVVIQIEDWDLNDHHTMLIGVIFKVGHSNLDPTQRWSFKSK